MRILITLVAFLLGIVPANGGGLRKTTSERRLQHHNNKYYWSLAEMMIYFEGECNIKMITASCSMPGYNATLIGKGKDPTPVSLEACELTSGGNKTCNKMSYSDTRAHDVLAEAFPDTNPDTFFDFQLALYDVLLYYKGNCEMTIDDQDTSTTTCSIPGSKSTLIGKGATPVPVSLEKCTLKSGGKKDCTTYSFNTRSSAKSVLQDAFPGMN